MRRRRGQTRSYLNFRLLFIELVGKKFGAERRDDDDDDDVDDRPRCVYGMVTTMMTMMGDSNFREMNIYLKSGGLDCDAPHKLPDDI